MSTPDKQTAILLEALRKALGNDAEYRLFKSGKLDGLFANRTGHTGTIATEALQCGYLESVRSETKGKMLTEWVRLTPRGVEYVYQHDSPQAVLGEMREMLRTAEGEVPGWLDAVLEQLKSLADRFGSEMQRYLQRLDVLAHRVEEAIRRTELGVPLQSHPVQGIVPWGWEALTYLDHRKQLRLAGDCAFPELFGAVKVKFPDLGISRFHEGLRRLEEHRAIQLLPFPEAVDRLPAPEYALLDGLRVLYYAKR